MARSWTPSQEAAMRLRGKTLLVSAAAGSGKTSVLTERIIRSLTDREHPADLSRMLIVTFTRAAAAELKGRIAEALSRAMAEYPSDPHLQRQLFLLGSAQISTIDSFFQKAVRANFEQLGLPSSFRIADESEIAPLCTEILDGLIEEYYQRYEGSASSSSFSAIEGNRFAAALDHLMSNRSDGKLDRALLDLQRACASYPEGIALLGDCARQLRADAEGNYFRSPCGSAVCRQLKEQFSAYDALLADLEEQLKTDPDAWRKLSGLFSSDRDYCRAMLEELEKEDYPRASLLSVSFVKGSFPTVKDKSHAVLSYQAWRTKFKKELEKVQELLHWAPEEIADQMRRTADFCEMLHTFFAEYESRLLAEKKTRGILEYNDVRAMLFSLLNEKDGSPTPFARSLAAQYDAVYIDEYQDVDFMQDRIFARIGENRRFMVGDIKQSIYRFRGSEPSIFANYRRTMPLYTENEAESADGVCVFMSDNFRCDRPVIDFANRICAFLFSACESSVGYRPQDDLICAKAPEKTPLPGHPAPVEVHVFGAAPRKGKSEEADTDEDGGLHEEALWVAHKIKRLLSVGELDNGSPVTPSDIAVLVRYKSHAKAYLKAMELLGIPTVSAVSKNIFEEPLMVDMRNLLRALDNPYRDLPLSEFLLSPLSEYTLEELSLIRSATDANASLFDSMEAAAKDPETYGELSEKCARTFADLQRLQTLSEGEPADRFLRALYAEEALKPYAKSHVLLYLYEQARLYQRSSFCGLYGFLEHLDSLAESKNASAEGFRATERAVTVMTVHHSKGLEFPVVFLASSGALFNKEDSKKTVLYHRDLGCATKLYRPETGENENTALRAAVILETENEQAEESIRTLYVALTRARERLYVSGTLRGKWDSALENASLIRYGDRSSILHATNPLLWILSAMSSPSRIKEDYPTPLVYHPYGSVQEEERGKKAGETNAQASDTPSAPEETSPLALRLARVLEKQKEFLYPRAFLEGLPAKAAASKLSPTLLDTLLDEEDGEAALDAQIRLLDSADRSFDSILLSSKTPSAAEIGTATHTFLEFCDYGRLVFEGVDAECSRLLAEGFIGERTAELLNRQQLEGFRKSELMHWIADADEVWREQTFSLLLPMSDFTANEERKVLLRDERLFVQGSIDCLLRRKDGKLILVDYKTDRIFKDEEANRSALISRMAEQHGSQLRCYAKAVEHLFGKAPDEIYVYSLPLGELIPFTP